jgi:hypothetical protein
MPFPVYAERPDPLLTHSFFRVLGGCIPTAFPHFFYPVLPQVNHSAELPSPVKRTLSFAGRHSVKD